MPKQRFHVACVFRTHPPEGPDALSERPVRIVLCGAWYRRIRWRFGAGRVNRTKSEQKPENAQIWCLRHLLFPRMYYILLAKNRFVKLSQTVPASVMLRKPRASAKSVGLIRLTLTTS
jgi:hypothetical protein